MWRNLKGMERKATELRRFVSYETPMLDKLWASKLCSKMADVEGRGRLSAFSDEVGS